jgi:protoporphyrinogen oxidase
MNVVLGAGLAGLSAGHVLVSKDRKVTVIEKAPYIGGLARTVRHDGFGFDLGGHRFITRDKEILDLVKQVIHYEYLDVQRKSKIYFLEKYFDYPLKPANAVFGLGLNTTLKILYDYVTERAKSMVSARDIVSLEDWVVSRFGRKMFELYFRQYSEKVWGVDCRNISQEWVAQRIRGLSLWEATKNAFFSRSGRGIETLADGFIYPAHGIGEISECLGKRIQLKNTIMTSTKVLKIEHNNGMVRSITVSRDGEIYDIEGSDFISTIPLTDLLYMLDPLPPDDVIDSASRLHFRDLVVVTLFLDRERITDLTWLYLPERRIPFGRIHEPINWSPLMAPEGKTHLVSEYFCFRGDRIWSSHNDDLAAVTLDHLVKLGFLSGRECVGSSVVRVPKAYPLLDVGYRKHYHKIMRFLEGFKNLHIAGRGGTFQYLNMDHSMRSGIEAARRTMAYEHEGRDDEVSCVTGSVIL